MSAKPADVTLRRRLPVFALVVNKMVRRNIEGRSAVDPSCGIAQLAGQKYPLTSLEARSTLGAERWTTHAVETPPHEHHFDPTLAYDGADTRAIRPADVLELDELPIWRTIAKALEPAREASFPPPPLARTPNLLVVSSQWPH